MNVPPVMVTVPSLKMAQVASSKRPSFTVSTAPAPVLRRLEPLAYFAPRYVPFSTISVPLLLTAPNPPASESELSIVPLPVMVSTPSFTMGRPVKAWSTVMEWPAIFSVNVLPTGTVAIMSVVMPAMSAVISMVLPLGASAKASCNVT